MLPLIHKLLQRLVSCKPFKVYLVHLTIICILFHSQCLKTFWKLQRQQRKLIITKFLRQQNPMNLTRKFHELQIYSSISFRYSQKDLATKVGTTTR